MKKPSVRYNEMRQPNSLTRNSRQSANMTTQSQSSLEALAPPEVAAETARLERHGYLFGLHLTNSWSPFLHDVIYQHLGLHWGQVRLDSADMDLFLKLIQHPNFYGQRTRFLRNEMRH